jgi:hypothetical protein
VLVLPIICIRRIFVRLSPSIHFVDSLSAASREAFDTFQTKDWRFGSIEISAAYEERKPPDLKLCAAIPVNWRTRLRQKKT